MRICSLLPSATEILYALDLGDQVVGVTFECDYPEAARNKPTVVGSVLPHDLAPEEIDRAVSEYAARGESIYAIDRGLLASIAPDIIITQELCDVCAVSTSHLAKALYELLSQPQIVSLTPHTLDDVWADVEAVGRAAGCEQQARELAASLRDRVERVKAKPKQRAPRVACLEWLSPPFNAGHWVPEMIANAGGIDPLGALGQDSTRMEWETIRAVEPDVVLVMPCGYDAGAAAEEYRQTALPAWWNQLPAVRNGQVYAVNATAHFSRPGPRLADGVELAYELLQQEFVTASSPQSWIRL